MKKTPKLRSNPGRSLSDWARRLFLRPASATPRHHTTWDDLPSLLDIRQAAEVLVVHPNTLRLWDKRGLLKAVRIGSRQDRRYPKERVQEMYDRRRVPPAPQHARVRQFGAKKPGFAPILITVASILAAVIFLARPTAHADETASREYRLRPQTCEGWQFAGNATSIQLPPVATGRDFSRSNSALFRADEQAVTTNEQTGGVITGTLDQQQDATITCSHFSTDGLPSDGELVNAKITLSLFAATAQNSTDAFIVEGSANSKDWFPIAMFPDRERAGSYNIIPLNQLVYPAQFADLAIRIRADAASYSADTQAALDGVEIVATIARPLPEAPLEQVAPQNRIQSGGIVAFSQASFQASEQPVMTVPKLRQKSFLFFRGGSTSWSVDSVALTNVQAKRFVPLYHVREQGSGASRDQQIQIDTHGMQPGKYRLSVAMTSSAGKKETVESDFTWGVVALNVTRAVARPGSEQEVGMAVLDDMGHTICDAKLELTVTDPKGKKQRFSTSRGSIETSGECVDKGVTNKPDYAARFPVAVPGLYHLHLDAETSAGNRQLDDTFTAEPAASFDVARVDFPTRIYPLAEYTVRFAITPLKDYTGIVREKLSKNMTVSAFQPEAATRQNPDDPNEQFVEWAVEWKAGETYFLSYTFDAPDISPELFLLGQFSIGGSFTDAPLFAEQRQWQLASDSVGAAVSQHLFESGFELQSVTAGVEWTGVGGSPVIDTTTVRSGSAALRAQVTGAATTEYMYSLFLIEAQDDYYLRAYVRIATSVSTQTRLFTANDGTDTWDFASLRLNTDDTLSFYLEDSSANIQIGSNSAALSKNTWYRLEFRFDTNNLAAIEMDARIDGVSFASSSGVYSSTGSVMGIGVGFISTAATGDVYFDDVGVTNDAGGSPENWPGEGKIVHLHPNAAGDTQTCDANTFATVDEVTPNDATDYVTCDATNDVAEFNVEDTSVPGISANDIINYVAVGNRVRRATLASASNTARIRVPNGNTLSSGTAYASNSTTWRTNATNLMGNRLRAFDQTDTADNDPITPADVDAAQIGIIVTDADPDTWVTTMWLLVEYVPAPGGRLYSSGFELQDVTNSGVEWATVSGTLAISTSVKHGGSASMTIGSLASATEESVEQDFVASNDSGPFWGRVYLNVTTLPSAENRIIEFQNSSNTVLLYITLSSTGTLSLYDEDGQVGSASRAITTSVWYRVEFKLDATGAGATDTIEGKINGETFATSATRNLSTGITSLVIGGNLNGEAQTTGTWNMDDVAVNKNAGSVQNGYPGAGFITHLRPNATGDNSAWTNANTEIDEVTPDDGTTAITSSTADQVEDVNLDSTSTGGIGTSDTINLVSVGFRFALDSGSTQSDVAVRIRENTNNPSIEGPRWPVTTTTWQTNSSSTPRLPSLTLYDEPLQNAAWTTTDLDTTQIGVRLSTDGSTANMQVTALWLLVDYTPKVTIQGNAYTDEGSTALDGSSVNKTVNLLINGFGSDTDEITASSGAWDVQNLTLLSGDIVTVYLDGETEKAATIYVSDATAKSDVHVFQNRIIVRADTGSITNANINTGDNTDTDVPVSVSSGNLTVDSGFELHVYTGDMYAPGGTVTTDTTGGLFHLDDNAAVTLANATNSIGTDATIDTGATLTVNANTVVAGGDITATGTLTTSSGTPTITMRGTGNISGAGSKTIYNLAIGDGTTAATTLTGSATVSNDVSVATGSTFNVNADISAAGGDFTNTGTGVINTTSGTPTVTVSGTGTIGGVSGSTTFYNLTLSGTPTFGSNFMVNNNLTLPASVTAGSTTVTMAGTAGTLVGGGSTIYALTIDPSSAGTITLNTSDLTVSNTLTVAASDALTLASGRTMTLSGNSGTTLSLSGTINGPGRLTYQNSATTFPTGGTLALVLITRFDTVNGNMVVPARTDYGAIEAFGSSANARTVTLGTAGSQTITTSSHLYVIADAASPNHVTLQGATYDPTLNVGGDLDFTGTGAADEIVTAPDAAATWTVSGNVNLTDGTWTASAETLTMNGTSKTLTSDGETLFNVTLSGTITLANATHTISGNLNLSGTIIAGTSTVTMTGTSKTIDGGGNTLANLTISGTETLQNTDLTVSTTLTVDSSKSITLNSSRTLALSGNSGTTLSLSGTINGPGRLTYQNSATTFPTGGTLALALITRFDTKNGNMNIPARTDYGVIEAFGDSANARTVTLGTAGSQTITTSSHFYVIANADTPNHITLQSATYDPTLNVGGDLDFTGTGSANEVVTAPDAAATWTVSGNVNLTDGTWTASAETLTMNGTSKTLTTDSETLFNVTLSGTITLANATHTVAGNLNLSGTITAGSSTVAMTGTSKTIDGGGNTLANLTISGTETLQNTDLTVSTTLTVDSAKSLTINSGRTLTLSGNSGTTLSLSGTINGPGRLTYQNSATTFPTGGTLALVLITRFDTVNGNMVVPARTDYGAIEAFGSSANARTVTLGTAGSQTITTSSYLYVIADAASPNHITLQGATYDPTLNVGGDLDFTGTGAADEVVTAPDAAATWTVSGSVNLTDGTWTTSAEMLTMNGTSKTLTTDSETLFNLTLSGTITLANATHTVAGNLNLSGTTTAGSSTVAMTGTSKTIDGGGNTLANLTISGTETLQNTDLTVSTALTVDDTKSLTINSGRTLTLSGNSGTTLSLTGTINGPGRLTYQNSATTFPTGGTLASTLITRFDTKNGNMVVPARTDYGAIEAFGDSANARTVTLGTAGSQTITTSSYLYVMANAGSGNDMTLQGVTWDPTLNVGGDLDFTGTGSANEVVTAPDAAATWTVSGNVNLTDGTWTASAETLKMNGTANLIGASQTVKHLTIDGSGNTVTVTTSDISVSGTLTIGGAADGNNDTLSIAASRTVTSGTSGTVTFVASGTDTISGSGTLTVQNSNLDTDGTLSAITRLDATSGNITMPARTYGGLVEAYSNATDAGKTVTMGSGTHTLSGALNLLAANTQNLTLAGTTNDPTLNLTGDLDFTGSGDGTEIITAPDTGSVTWTASGNVDFSGGTYTKGTETLVMNGTTKTLTSNSNSLNNFEVSAGSVTMVGTTAVSGNLTISGGTLSAPSSGALNVAGNWNNSGGTFTDNSSTVTFNGSSQQTAQGTMTGSSDFNNLIITNASGSDPDTSPSVIFSAAATVSGTFTATTASTKIRFNASSTYTFQNISFNGQATTTRVFLRSSSAGTAWNLNVAGTRTVSNTDVKDSNACGQPPDIDATDGTNKDSGNNPCWATGYLTVSLSPTDTVSLGTLDTTNVNQASMTSTVTTTAASGYVSTVYYNATLTSGLNTIPDADGTIAPNGSEFGASTDDTTSVDLSTTSNSCATGNGTYNATALSTTAKTIASESAPISSDVTTLCFSAGISTTQAPGSYTSTMTVVTTGKF